MGNSMMYSSKPETFVISEKGKHPDFIYAAASVQGWRKSQEDRYQIRVNLRDNLSYFAVFDGHGGFEIAEWLKENFHDLLYVNLPLNDDIELVLSFTFMEGDEWLRAPNVMAELNEMVEEATNTAGAGKHFSVEKTYRISASSTLRKKTVVDYLASLSSTEDEQDQNSDDKPSGSGVGSSGSVKTETKIEEIPGPRFTRGPFPVKRNPGQLCLSADLSSGSKEEPVGSNPTISDQPPSLNKEYVQEELLKAVAATIADNSAAATPTTSKSDEHGDSKNSSPDDQNVDDKPEFKNPLEYLLHDDLASSDTEDPDFELGSDSFSDNASDEEMPFPAESILKQEPGDFSGSTGTVVLLGNKKLFVANVGDSRCVMSRQGIAIDLSEDHNLDDPEERERVIGAGAKVSSDGRINNSINISRAFGDFHLKKDPAGPVDSPVTPFPYIKTVDVQEDDDFVIVASDGIWNSLSSQEVVDYVNQRIRDKDGSLIHICEELFKLIMPDEIPEDGYGCDNMTMIIIKLNAKEEHDYLVDDIGTEEMEVCSTHSDSTE